MTIAGRIERLKLKTHQGILTPRVVSKICASQSSIVREVGAALEAHIAGTFSPDELRWVEQIESLRSQIEQSRETVPVPDYGAGSPDDTLSDDQMLAGRMTTEVVGEACRNYSKPRSWATLLFRLLTRFKPQSCLEMGTCLGISASYQSAALELNGAGKLISLEGAPSFAAIAHKNLETLGLAHRASIIVGRFADTFDQALEQLGKVDYAFIDGHHDEQATIAYFQQLRGHLASQAMVVFDDTAWSPGMQRAWKQICDDPSVDVSFDLRQMGVCLLGLGVKARYALTLES
jgi:predicted O-methyltransferase YrrM